MCSSCTTDTRTVYKNYFLTHHGIFEVWRELPGTSEVANVCVDYLAALECNCMPKHALANEMDFGYISAP